MSCFPCRAVMRCGRSGHEAVGSGPASGFFSRVIRLRIRGMAFLLSTPASFHPPAGGGTLIRAFRERAGACRRRRGSRAWLPGRAPAREPDTACKPAGPDPGRQCGLAAVAASFKPRPSGSPRRGNEAPGAAGSVTGCHDMSCFLCRAVMRCGRSGHEAVGSGPASGFFSGAFRLRVRGMAFLLSAPVPFHPPAAGGTLIRAFRERAGACRRRRGSRA